MQLDLLVRGDEVALAALGEQLHGVGLGDEPDAPHARLDPGRQLLRQQLLGVNAAAVLLEGLDPGARAVGVLDLVGDHEQQHVRRRVGERGDQRLAAFDAGLRRRHPELDDASLREQRHRAQAGGEFVPVEAALDEQHVAAAVAERPGTGADRVGGLADAQRLVAGHQPRRREGRLQRPRQRLRHEPHQSAAACVRRMNAATLASSEASAGSCA